MQISTAAAHDEKTFPDPDAAGQNGDPTPDSVDKIRDILFGSNMRDYDRKFTRLEERLSREAGELRHEMTQRFNAIENLLKGGMDALAEAQKTEKAERNEALATLSASLKGQSADWKTEAARTAEQTAAALRDLGQLVHAESRRLGEEFEHKHAGLTASHAQEAQALRAMLTDRFALAELFSEVAGRLKNGSPPTRKD